MKSQVSIVAQQRIYETVHTDLIVYKAYENFNLQSYTYLICLQLESKC